MPGFVTEQVEFEVDDRGIRRQLDAVLRNRDGPYPLRIMVEATTRRAPVNLEEMDAFVTKARSLNCQLMVVVSSTGFTGPALASAKAGRVQTWILRAIQDSDLEGTIGRIGVRARIQSPRSHSFSLGFRKEVPPEFTQFTAADRDRLMVYGEGGAIRGNLWDFVQSEPKTQGSHRFDVQNGDFMLIGAKKYELSNFSFQVDVDEFEVPYELDLDDGLLAIYENAQNLAERRFIRWREGLPAEFEFEE